MKRLIFFLLTLLTLNLHAQVLSNGVIRIADTTYHPRISDNGTVYRQAGFSVVTPTSVDRTKKYSVWLAIHGTDERSNGTINALRNALQGFDYDGNGPNPRIPATVHEDMLSAVKAGKCIVVSINYQNECNPIDINAAMDEVEVNYPVDKERWGIIGFSLGGGAVMRYITSSQANADRVAFAIAVAPVSWATTWTYSKNSRLIVWGVTNTTDPRVSPSNVKTMMANYSALGPDPAGRLIILPGSGHGGIKEIEALNYAPQNIYDYLNSITKNNPLPYPTATTPPVVVPPTTTVPVLKYTAPDITSTPSFKLQACPSTGWDSFKWGVLSVPKGANVYAPYVTSGAGWCEANVTLTVEGAYSFFAQACKGTSCVRDTFVVTYQKTTIPVPRNPVSFETITGMLLFSDGTTEQATAMVNFTTKKVTVKTVAGKEYTW